MSWSTIFGLLAVGALLHLRLRLGIGAARRGRPRGFDDLRDAGHDLVAGRDLLGEVRRVALRRAQPVRQGAVALAERRAQTRDGALGRLARLHELADRLAQGGLVDLEPRDAAAQAYGRDDRGARATAA